LPENHLIIDNNLKLSSTIHWC